LEVVLEESEKDLRYIYLIESKEKFEYNDQIDIKVGKSIVQKS